MDLGGIKFLDGVQVLFGSKDAVAKQIFSTSEAVRTGWELDKYLFWTVLPVITECFLRVKGV
jgi:hypothetical protein